MEVYESFARVYDSLMDDVPYREWADRILSLLREEGMTGGLALDLGCGTGKMTRLMDRAGYDMIGIDASLDMLQIARENSPDGILYLLQDMREFELYGTVGAVISVCDSLNYILSEEELLEVFSLVRNYLDPGGFFVFDINTEHKYRDVIGDSVIAEDRDRVSFIWYNRYEEEERRNYIDLNVFVREEDGRYRKFSEMHIQAGYTYEMIAGLIRQSGLVLKKAFDGYSMRPADDTSERILFVCRKQELGENNE
ncbi:MAG: class I SAM-dependent methyltransferase [Eubacterium sp.]|nr:class I SAM-dependent methyltransferase [Eubacterium sp.]